MVAFLCGPSPRELPTGRVAEWTVSSPSQPVSHPPPRTPWAVLGCDTPWLLLASYTKVVPPNMPSSPPLSCYYLRSLLHCRLRAGSPLKRLISIRWGLLSLQPSRTPLAVPASRSYLYSAIFHYRQRVPAWSPLNSLLSRSFPGPPLVLLRLFPDSSWPYPLAFFPVFPRDSRVTS